MKCYDDFYKGDKMRIFVSWSGELSKNVAEVIKKWIPSILQSVEVFFSPDDIEKGQNWSKRIEEELNECNFGIVCLTPKNTNAPWINFEAGALAKTLDTRLAALLININPSDIKGPIASFQATIIRERDFYKLCQSINNGLGEAKINEDILKRGFTAIWPILEKEINDLITKDEENSDSNQEENKDPEINNKTMELLETLLQELRESNRYISDPEKLLPRSYIEIILKNGLNSYVEEKSVAEYINDILSFIYGIIKYDDCVLDKKTLDVIKSIVACTGKFINLHTMNEAAETLQLNKKVRIMNKVVTEKITKMTGDFPQEDDGNS